MGEKFGLGTMKRENLGDGVYARLSEALIQGRFPPDHRLTIRDLADSLGTSVTPVRDALLRLIQDGALEQRSPRDVRVPILSVSRYEEIRAMRVRLEGLAARECALRAGPADVTRMRQIDHEMHRAIDADDWSRAVLLNQQFHFSLAEIGGMELLRATLQRLWLQMGPLIAAYYRSGNGRTRGDEHHVIIDAVARGDADAAEQAIRKEILEAGEPMFAEIAKLQGTDIAV